MESLPEGASFFQKYTAFNIGGKSAGGLVAGLIIGGGLGIGGIVAAGKKLKETFSELKRVTWPTFPKVVKSTCVVLLVVVVFFLVVTGINQLFQYLLEQLTKLGG